jgi:hypothetical protein
MDPRTDGRRELAVLAAALVGASRLVDPPVAWAVVALTAATLVAGAWRALDASGPRSVPFAMLILPSAAAVVSCLAIRLVPVEPILGLAIVAAGVLVQLALTLEARLAAAVGGASSAVREQVVWLALIVAFVGFVGIAGAVPGGLVDPDASSTPVGSLDVAILAMSDAALAAVLGYRLAALRIATTRDVLAFATTSAAVVLVAAGALHALAVPRLLGPALLTLVFFLWEALHAAGPARRRDARWLWEVVLLAALGLVVVALNGRLAT